MNMIEKVARALHDSVYKHSPKDENTEQDYLEMKASFMEDARAAIEAMREAPNVAYDNYKCDKLWKDLNSKEVFNLWIDAALKE